MFCRKHQNCHQYRSTMMLIFFRRSSLVAYLEASLRHVRTGLNVSYILITLTVLMMFYCWTDASTERWPYFLAFALMMTLPTPRPANVNVEKIGKILENPNRIYAGRRAHTFSKNMHTHTATNICSILFGLWKIHYVPPLGEHSNAYRIARY